MSRMELATYKPKTGAEKLAWAMIQKAWTAHERLAVSAAKEVTDRVEGSATLHVRVGQAPLEELSDEELEERLKELMARSQSSIAGGR